MLTYKGGNQTKGGFYLKKGEWEMVTVDGKSGMLPGDNECEYVKIPALLFVPLMVTLGGVFVIFLPFIGFAMLFTVIATKAGKGMSVLGHALAQRLGEWQLPVRLRATAEKLTGLKHPTGVPQ